MSTDMKSELSKDNKLKMKLLVRILRTKEFWDLTEFDADAAWEETKKGMRCEKQKNKWIFLFKFCKFRNPPYPLFYFHRQLYKVKGKFSIEIFLPWIHIYYEYKVGQYGQGPR